MPTSSAKPKLTLCSTDKPPFLHVPLNSHAQGEAAGGIFRDDPLIQASAQQMRAYLSAGRHGLKALHDIPEEFRMVVYYAVVDGLPYAEIAEIMGTPVGTVMSRLHRGKKMLRKMLAEYAAEEGYDVSNKTGVSND